MNISKNSLQLLLIACFCFLLFSLYYPLFYFEGYDGKRELQIIILLFVQCLLFFPIVFRQYTDVVLQISLKIKILISAFLVSGFISALLATHPLYAWGDWLQIVLYVNGVLIVMAVLMLWPYIKKIILAAILCGFCLGLIEFVFRSIIGIYLDSKISPALVYPNFGSYRFFNQVHIQLAFILAALSFTLPLRYRNWAIIFGSIGIFMLMIGGARGAMLSIIVVLVFSYFISGQYLKQLSNRLIKMIVIGIVFYLAYLVYEVLMLESDSSGYLLRTTSSGRLRMWFEIIPAIFNNPLGIGPYHYSGFSEFSQRSHPHNSILQIFLEWGWLAGFSLFFLMVRFLLHIKKMLASERNYLRLALGCSLLAACLYSLFSGVFVMPVSQITFVFLLALLFSNDFRQVNNGLVDKRDGSEKALIFVKLKMKIVTLVLILSLSVFYGMHMAESYRRYSESADTDSKMQTIGPRAWAFGGIIPAK